MGFNVCVRPAWVTSQSWVGESPIWPRTAWPLRSNTTAGFVVVRDDTLSSGSVTFPTVSDLKIRFPPSMRTYSPMSRSPFLHSTESAFPRAATDRMIRTAEPSCRFIVSSSPI